MALKTKAAKKRFAGKIEPVNRVEIQIVVVVVVVVKFMSPPCTLSSPRKDMNDPSIPAGQVCTMKLCIICPITDDSTGYWSGGILLQFISGL